MSYCPLSELLYFSWCTGAEGSLFFPFSSTLEVNQSLIWHFMTTEMVICMCVLTFWLLSLCSFWGYVEDNRPPVLKKNSTRSYLKQSLRFPKQLQVVLHLQRVSPVVFPSSYFFPGLTSTSAKNQKQTCKSTSISRNRVVPQIWLSLL